MPGLMLLAAYHFSQPGDGVRYVPCDLTAVQWRVFVGMDRLTSEGGEVAVVPAGYVFPWPDNPVVFDQLGEDGQVVAVGFAGAVLVAVGCHDRPAGEPRGVLEYYSELSVVPEMQDVRLLHAFYPSGAGRVGYVPFDVLPAGGGHAGSSGVLVRQRRLSGRTP